MHTPRFGSRRNEEGSLPLVLLLSIVAAGLVSVLFGAVLTSKQAAAHDRTFTEAFDVADAGMQEAYSYLADLNEAGLLVSAPSTTLNGSTIDGSFDATLSNAGSGVWEVRSEGVVSKGDRSTTRYLEATIKAQPRFFLAAFGKVLVGTKGSNGAKSYNGTTWDTGLGAVGSNRDVQILGGTPVDEVHLFGPDAVCSQTTSNCKALDDAGDTLRYPDPIVLETEFMNEALNDPAVCPTIAPWDSSVDGTDISYADAPVKRVVGGRKQGVYCFTSMNFRASTTVTVDAAADEELVIYVSGAIDTANSVKINCSWCLVDNPAGTIALGVPRSRSLQIYSTGDTVSIGNQSILATAIYAPGATCVGSPSVAQAEIYGSMICSTISNQGGWNFYYDQDLIDITSLELGIFEFREEIGGTTSF